MKIKTEHNGSKKGSGAFWGPKKFAKHISNKLRRREAKQHAKELQEEKA